MSNDTNDMQKNTLQPVKVFLQCPRCGATGKYKAFREDALGEIFLRMVIKCSTCAYNKYNVNLRQCEVDQSTIPEECRDENKKLTLQELFDSGCLTYTPIVLPEQTD